MSLVAAELAQVEPRLFSIIGARGGQVESSDLTDRGRTA